MIIRGGSVVTEKEVLTADVQVKEEKIVKIAHSIRPHSGENVIDALGLFLLPGMADAHVHFRDFKDVFKEDWLSGTSAALAGGVTSVIEMPNSSLPTISREALEAKRMVAAKKALCDYAFFFGATEQNHEEVQRVQHEKDVAGLKVYMGPSTGPLHVQDFGALYRHFAAFKKPSVVHAEDGDCLSYFSPSLPQTIENHSRLRNPLCAELAISKALLVAARTKTRLHFAHVSSPEEVALVAQAKREGLPVTCEVSPHHLFLDETHLKTLGNKAKVNPPLRSKRQRLALWEELKKGRIDCLATDHAPHLSEEKALDYADAPSGMPGLDTALPLLLNAVNEKQLELVDVARLYSYSPAKIFGLKKKGKIAVGMDADLVLVNLKKPQEILDGNLFTKCGWSAFEGWKLKGRIESVFVRGQLAFEEGHIVARLPFGKPLSLG